MQAGTLRTCLPLLALAGALLAPAARGAEPELQRLVASDVRQGVDGMAALPDVLVLRQGSALFGLDPYSLQQLWVYSGEGLVSGPFAVGERLFAIQRTVQEDKSGSTTTFHSILEIDPASGLLQRRRKEVSSSTWLLSGCGRAVFVLGGSMFAVVGTKPLSRISPAKHLKRELARAFDPMRVRLAGSHLLAWVPELRLEVSLDLERDAQAWQRGFAEEIVEVGGCGSVQVATTAEGTLLGLDARTGETVWQSRRPEGLPAFPLLQSGQPRSLEPGFLPAWVDLKDGSLRIVPEEDPDRPRDLLEDGHGWVLIHQKKQLAAYGGPSGGRWSYDAGEPIRLLSAAGSYVALLAETGRLDVLGQSRAGALEPPPADAGDLELAVDPEDAQVWLDGSYLGSGVRSLAGLRPGVHRLLLVHPDRRRLDAEVEVAPGRTAPLSLALERRSEGPLLVESTPPAADVFLDGKKDGTTPYTAYDRPPGQVVKLTVSKRGYRNVSRTLALREEGAKLDVDLTYAPPLAGLFGVTGYTDTGAIRGWREADIREGRVEGEPYRPGDGNAFAAIAGFGELGSQRLRLFARGAFSTQEDVFGEIEGGLWLAASRKVRVEVGTSYLRLGLNDDKSEPPTRQREGGFGGGEDKNAPLERWSHPIPGVFVENEPPSYLLGKLRLRPHAGLLVELGAGLLLEGARLRGTALVPDAEGHLVKDAARSYDFQGRNGGILDARLQLALGTFRIWKLAPSTAVDIHYQRRWADFGPARESTGALTVGLGVLSFNNEAGVAP